MEYFDLRSPMTRLAREETPNSADDIDLDRVVWDPDYRSCVRDLLVPEPTDG